MVIEKIKKGLVVGVCAATIITASVPTCAFANSPETNNQTILPTVASASVDLLNENSQETDNPGLTVQTGENSCNIQLTEIGSYSVYQKGIQSLNVAEINKTNKTLLVNEVVDKYVCLGSEILGNQVKIENLKPATKYHLYVYKNQEPVQNALIKEFDIITKPETIYGEEISKTSNSVEFGWNEANNAEKYEIYRNGELVDTVTNNKYSDEELKESTTYTYQIKARYADSEIDKQSSPSEEFDIKTDKLVVLPSLSMTSDGETMGLPAVSGECKTWANYKAVTARSSPQYKLLNSDACYTDTETGIRMVDDCCCVALGSFYGSTIGQKYLIKLSSGNEFKAILCDQKSDKHTDANHQYAIKNKDIIEFYIDKQYKPPTVDGSYGSLSQFSGSVVSIQKISS